MKKGDTNWQKLTMVCLLGTDDEEVEESDPMDIKSVKLHPNFPEKVWVVVEQPGDEVYRLSYDRKRNKFVQTANRSLIYEREFKGVYGWVGGMGIPPEKHCDVLMLTHQNHQVGEVILGYVCGVFYRKDGDHKIVALDAEWRRKVSRANLETLDETTYNNLMGLYPRIDEGEGWYSVDEALTYLEQMVAR